MASSTSTGSGTPTSVNRKIPLVCTVCPETPKFSDVSHLLTHIASKGHLHHETQMKLKAHQDISSSVALQQYDQWYTEHGIESLLVERLKAKQVKEASRHRRLRQSSSSTPLSHTKKRIKRTSGKISKPDVEQDSSPSDLSIYPGFLQHEGLSHDADNIFNFADALSLKGQVWPGMGKIDLANDEMRRTRNQRKPKSVIEKMRRISEGIEPTQVVMTPDFSIDRVKDVYDDVTPLQSDDEDESHKPVARSKRKRPVLAEISGNVPRSSISRETRSLQCRPNKKPKGAFSLSADFDPGRATNPFKNNNSMYYDGVASENAAMRLCQASPLSRLNMLESHHQSSDMTCRDPRFEPDGMVSFDRPSMPSLAFPSQSPQSCNTTGHYMSNHKDSHHMKSQTHPYLSHPGLITPSQLTNDESLHALHDVSMMNCAPQSHFLAPSPFTPNMTGQKRPYSPARQSQIKAEDHAYRNNHTMPGSGSFLKNSDVNPLLSQDRLFAGLPDLTSSTDQLGKSPCAARTTYPPVNGFHDKHDLFQADLGRMTFMKKTSAMRDQPFFSTGDEPSETSSNIETAPEHDEAWPSQAIMDDTYAYSPSQLKV